MTNLNEFGDTLLKIKRRKRTWSSCRSNVKQNDVFKILDLKGSQSNVQFRTVALAMKWGCVMNEASKKYTNNSDIEIDVAYEGCLKEYEPGLPRFQKLVDMICKMLKVVNAFSKHASDTGRPVLVGKLQDKRFNIPSHPLAFNPKQFSLKEYQYHMDNEAKRILQLPWINRSEEEVKKVWGTLRHLKQYRIMTSTMQDIMARYARYEMHGKNRTIVRKGDPGRHYYFIYSGQVELRNIEGSTSTTCPKLNPGQDFGHVALLHMEKRTASIVCSEDTEFVVLDRRGNGRAVYRALHMMHKRKRRFLKSIDLFDGLEEMDYRHLADHSRITQYLPMSLVASVQIGHPQIYIIMDGVANVALTTDVYSCCTTDSLEREKLINYDRQRKCNHKSCVLHDVFTQRDPTLSIIIQQLKDGHIFGAQHMLHKKSGLPALHLIAKSKLTVLSVPVYSVMHFAKPVTISIIQDKYPVYPSVQELVRQYMEGSVWELYKAYVIRDLLHFNGRVDPAKKCKFCLSCQLRSLMVSSILPDPLREEVAELYCPGSASPLPSLAQQTFRPRSAPPQLAPRPERRRPSPSRPPSRRSPEIKYVYSYCRPNTAADSRMRF